MPDDPGEYERKRDFRKTPEPASGSSGGKGEPFFVIQEHDASSHHYDFRIELDGVLVSWAVPKGPSTDPREKRLAIRTEDHPVEYGDFEGVIPEDEYGGGAVSVWDQGPFSNAKTDEDGGGIPLFRQLEEGKITVELRGEKIRGGYALVRTSGGEGEQWLLVKVDDDGADARRNPVSTEPGSVKSGRTIEEVRKRAEEG